MNNLLPILSNIGINFLQHSQNVAQPEICIKNIELSNKIHNLISAEYGDNVLKFSVNEDLFLRYKSGKYSSMLKGATGIGRHEGFDVVSIADIIDSVLYYVSCNYSETILFEIRSVADKMLSFTAMMGQELQQTMIDEFKREHVNSLEAIWQSLQDILDNLSVIVISEKLIGAYLSDIIKMRREILKIFQYMAQEFDKYIFLLEVVDGQGRYMNPFPENVAYYHSSQCHIAISCFVLCCMLEDSLGDTFNEQSEAKTMTRVLPIVTSFTNLEAKLKNHLILRQYQNTYSSYTYYYNNYENFQAGFFIENCIKDPNYYCEIVKVMYGKSKNILENTIYILNKED